MRVVNFSVTGCRTERRLFSARVSRKFLMRPSLSAPTFFWSSATMAFLSAGDSEGDDSSCVSLGSFLKTAARLSRALAVGSSEDVLAAAVYCRHSKPSACVCSVSPPIVFLVSLVSHFISSPVGPGPIASISSIDISTGGGDVPERSRRCRRRRTGQRAAWSRVRRPGHSS